MKFLEFRQEIHEFYREDVGRMRTVLRDAGYDVIREHDLYEVWSAYSDRACAQWLSLPKSDPELLKILLKMFNGEDPYDDDN